MEQIAIVLKQAAPAVCAAIEPGREPCEWAFHRIGEDSAWVVLETTRQTRERALQAFARAVVREYEPVLVRSNIRRHYRYFSGEELTEIALQAQGHLMAQQSVRRRVGMVTRALDSVSREVPRMDLDGVLTFRCREYMDAIDDAVDRAVDDLLMEREYREFIRLLKCFVDAQPSRIGKVNAILKPEGAFVLLDAQGQPIESDTVQEFVVEMVDSELNYEDLLVSALITLAPARVVLHGPPELMEAGSAVTVRDVYAGRADVCPGCVFCAEAQRRHHR